MPRTLRKRRGSKRRLRHYRAEYRRRIARARAKGLSLSQARGHAKPNERPVAIKRHRMIGDRRFQAALKAVRKGKNIHDAAKIIGTSSERLTRQLEITKAARKRGRRWIVRDDLPRRMLIFSDKSAKIITVGTRRAASSAALFMGAVGRLLHSNDRAEIAFFVGKSVTDIDGKVHRFETEPETLYRLAHTGAETFESVYRIVI